MHYELCIMNCFRAFRFASGFPLYLCSPQSHLASPNPFPKPVPESRSRYPLAKDAAPIPNALDAPELRLQAIFREIRVIRGDWKKGK